MPGSFCTANHGLLLMHQVVTTLQLRHRSAMSISSASPSTALTMSRGLAQSDGISVDPTSSIVQFLADDLSQCIPSLLEQWERLCRVIVIIGDSESLVEMGGFQYV